ncbi:coiled-coil domain-containing protein 138 isoform X2 [Monodon monoceros]|uniref:coiled-coil domain-containing protein 138 isoform X2 n=1 Tax=Monodon monoceros TaxID=40151 RepID=UPI0010F9CC22|nr:coiled-coil domain-containing protein 138 isoform X2 [Monodon monoceros]
MEPRVVRPLGQDLMVERLKSRYGVGGGCPAEPGRRRPDVAERRRRPPRTPEDFGFCSRGDEAGPSLRCYSDERRRGPASPRGALKRGTVSWQDEELDSLQDLKQQETEEEFIGNDHRVSTSEINKQSFKQINKVAERTNLASDSRNWTDCCNDASESPSKRVSSPASRASNKQGVLPRQVNQIYDELLQIYQKLQCGTAAQQEFAEELQKRERFLAEREELLFRHESALNKLKGVKEEVLTRFQILKEQHDAEVEHLTEVLKERNKESRRLRSSFDALKELNDSLKKQHSTMTSTLRRLGEDIFKGVVTKGLQGNSLEHSVESKPKTAAFFKSSSLPLRFFSTLIVLKTVTQGFLQPFLQVCSCSLFFRTCSVLLRGPKLDLHVLEKLSIILQKLSKIKSNKKLFELFTVHLMLQEIQRTTHPEHAFLCINLNSTLFNLGLTKCNSLTASTNP